jgi:hypothetical protein
LLQKEQQVQARKRGQPRAQGPEVGVEEVNVRRFLDFL